MKCNKCDKECGDKYVASYSTAGTPNLAALCYDCALKSNQFNTVQTAKIFTRSDAAPQCARP